MVDGWLDTLLARREHFRAMVDRVLLIHRCFFSAALAVLAWPLARGVARGVADSPVFQQLQQPRTRGRLAVCGPERASVTVVVPGHAEASRIHTLRRSIDRDTASDGAA